MGPSCLYNSFSKGDQLKIKLARLKRGPYVVFNIWGPCKKKVGITGIGPVQCVQ